MKKIKIILFDIDGVLMRPPHYFTEELENMGHKNATRIFNSFYEGDIKNNRLKGKIDAKKAVIPYLEKIGWRKKAEEYFEMQLDFESQYLDKEFMSMIKKFQSKGIKCYLCTDQDKNRAKLLLDKLKFKDIFDGWFVSSDIEYRKCENDFWVYVIKNLSDKFPDVSPNEIAFFDDIQENVDMASKFKIQAFLFKNKAKFNEDIKLLSLE